MKGPRNLGQLEVRLNELGPVSDTNGTQENDVDDALLPFKAQVR